jgi:hypothetical protein
MMKDWLGQDIGVGDKVLYAAGSGRSITMVIAEIVKFNEKSVSVMPVASSRWKQHNGEDYYIDTRTGKQVRPYGKGWGDPQVWSRLGYYKVLSTGEEVSNARRTSLLNSGHPYEDFKYHHSELQPYIEKHNKMKPVTLTVTKNITKWTGQLPIQETEEN